MFDRVYYECRCSAKLDAVLRLLKELKMNQQELAQALTDLGAKVQKIGTETTILVHRVADLTVALSNAPVTPEVQAALTALQNQAQVVDDLVPDAIPTP